MNEKPSGRQRTFVAVVAVVVVVLSGCAGASGNGEEVSLVQDGSEPSNTATSVQTTETAPGSDDTTPTAAGSESDAGVDSQAGSGADTGADTGTPTTETTETLPEGGPNTDRDSGGGSSGADDSSNSGQDDGGSSSGENDDSNPSNTATDAPERADACEAYEVREGPRANTELESDDEICITEWDNQAFRDSYTVTGVVGNPSGETIEHVSVEVTLYEHGNVLATKNVGIDDLGETDRFVVEFVEPFEGEGAPEPVGGISYRIHATVGESTETETTATATATPATTATPSPTPTATPTEPDGGVEGSVESDEYTAVTGHGMDASGGDVVVTGNVTNPTDARVSDPYVRITLYDDEGEEIAVGGDQATESGPISPLLEPGETGSFQVTFSDVDPDDVASYTIRSSAIDPDEDPATTRADIAVTFIRLSAYDDPVETYVEVTNQKEETVERLDVVITVYDDNGTAIAEHTERIADLAIGETVTFDHQFEVTEDEADRVEVDVPGQEYGFVN